MSQLKRLEEEINPLQEANHSLSAQCDTLSTEKKLMETEIGRWKARVNHLLEETKKIDPEELENTRWVSWH